MINVTRRSPNSDGRYEMHDVCREANAARCRRCHKDRANCVAKERGWKKGVVPQGAF